MATKTTNTTPNEAFDEKEVSTKLTKEEILEQEPNILAGLLELGDSKNNPDEYETIKICRNGVEKLSFRIRPLSEDENHSAVEKATKYSPAKRGKPRTAIKTDSAKARSYQIYIATVDEDRKKIWDNPEAKKHFNVLESVDMIDIILKAGEKVAVINKIDEISGFYDAVEEDAKNS